MRNASFFLAGAMLAAVTACGDSTGITVQDLEGTWIATSYVFTNDADATQQVDVITQGASFTMTVDADGTVSTVFDDGVGGTSSDSGTLSPTNTTLTLAGTVFDAQRSDDVLTLDDAAAAYDFDGDGSDDAASLQISMVRQ